MKSQKTIHRILVACCIIATIASYAYVASSHLEAKPFSTAPQIAILATLVFIPLVGYFRNKISKTKTENIVFHYWNIPFQKKTVEIPTQTAIRYCNLIDFWIFSGLVVINLFFFILYRTDSILYCNFIVILTFAFLFSPLSYEVNEKKDEKNSKVENDTVV